MNENPYSVGEGQAYGVMDLHGPKFDQALKRMQIIATCLLLGVFLYFVGTVIGVQGSVLGRQVPGMLTLFAGGFGALMIVNYFIAPSIITNLQISKLRQTENTKTDEAKIESLCGVFQTQLIIGMALLEGAAFFNLTVLTIEQHISSTFISLALFSLMLVKFPTRTKVSFRVQDKLRELQM